jgi:hypothetical protein
MRKPTLAFAHKLTDTAPANGDWASLMPRTVGVFVFAAFSLTKRIFFQRNHYEGDVVERIATAERTRATGGCFPLSAWLHGRSIKEQAICEVQGWIRISVTAWRQ